MVFTVFSRRFEVASKKFITNDHAGHSICEDTFDGVNTTVHIVIPRHAYICGSVSTRWSKVRIRSLS